MEKKHFFLIVILFVATSTFGQSNTCAYTFSFAKYSFQFCLTSSGTLAMLQSPIGIDHLDPANPIEGWDWALAYTHRGGGDTFWSGSNIPAYGVTQAPDSVYQPNGPGTLPIRFDWSAGMYEIVKAEPSKKSVVLTVGVTGYYGPGWGWWCEGICFDRYITPKVDRSTSNYFGNLRNGVFAYVEKGEGLAMDGGECFGPGESLSCGPSTPFVGYGTMIARGQMPKMKVTYRIF